MGAAHQNLDKERDHQLAMLSHQQKRLRVLQVQAAQQGFSTPPQIVVEIEELAEQIRSIESTLEQLEESIAQSCLPLAAAEYGLLVVQHLRAPHDRFSAAVWATLRVARLRLGITDELGLQIEKESRANVARQMLLSAFS
jgi:hypothetical protein